MLLLNEDFDLKLICELENCCISWNSRDTYETNLRPTDVFTDHKLLSVLVLNCNPSAIGALNFVTTFSKSLNKMSYVEMEQKQKGSWRKLF